MNEMQHSEQNDQCLDSGVLASLRDSELSAEERTQAIVHLVVCPDCTADERAMNASGQEVYKLLSALQPAQVPDTKQAFSALQARIDEESKQKQVQIVSLSGQGEMRPLPLKRRQHRVRWLALVAALLVALLVLPNAGVLANQFLALFRVQQFQPISLDASQLDQNFFSTVSDFGDLQTTQDKTSYPDHPTKAQVEQYTHFSLLLPTDLPQGVSNTPQYSIVSGERATFTFDAEKARLYMRDIGDGSVRIPAQLNGAVYTINVDPGASVEYTRDCPLNGNASDTCKGKKQLLMVEIPSPTVQGSKASSLNDLRNFMLSLPHLPSAMHDLWQHVDLSTGTVPVPLPTANTKAQPVTVKGTSGVLFTEDTLKYGLVIWQTQGIVYGIMTNTNDKAQILNTANSLTA